MFLFVPCVNKKLGPVRLWNSTWRMCGEYIFVNFSSRIPSMPSMNEFFDTKECDENTVDLEHLEKGKCSQEVLCKVERVTQNE